MGLWHVYDEGRQTECCGPPFSAAAVLETFSTVRPVRG